MESSRQIFHTLPPPTYLTMPGAGIDISSGSVRSVFFSGTKSDPRVTYRKATLPEGVIVNGDIENIDILADFLRAFRLREGIRFAHASLSEKKSFLYQTIVPRGEANLRDAIEFGLEEHVPIPPAEALFDYEVVGEASAGMLVSVTVYASRVVDAYVEAFTRAGIHLLSLEVESHACARALVHKKHRANTTMIVDFGRHATRVAVLDKGVVSFTTTIDVGGDALSRAIMKHYDVSEKEAEVIKNTRGFLENDEARELYETLMTTASVLRDEIGRHVTYWNSSNDGLIKRTPVQEILMVGGNANVRGFPEFLSRALELPVSVGTVWGNAFSLDEYIPPIPQRESLEYATAVGLALRSHHGL